MNDVIQKIYDIGIVPVIAIDDADKAVPLAKALVKGGLPAAEVTFRTAAAEEAIKRKEQAERRAYERSIGAATELGQALGIGYVRRLECYDISNTQGTDSAGGKRPGL